MQAMSFVALPEGSMQNSPRIYQTEFLLTLGWFQYDVSTDDIHVPTAELQPLNLASDCGLCPDHLRLARAG